MTYHCMSIVSRDTTISIMTEAIIMSAENNSDVSEEIEARPIKN